VCKLLSIPSEQNSYAIDHASVTALPSLLEQQTTVQWEEDSVLLLVVVVVVVVLLTPPMTPMAVNFQRCHDNI
jgi:hypothetical protein